MVQEMVVTFTVLQDAEKASQRGDRRSSRVDATVEEELGEAEDRAEMPAEPTAPADQPKAIVNCSPITWATNGAAR